MLDGLTPAQEALAVKHGRDASDRWRTPQHMPASLARWRKPVLGVEAREITTVSEETWVAAGFEPWHFGDPDTLPSDRAYETWISHYGPGSWSGWVWVVTLGKEDGA